MRERQIVAVGFSLLLILSATPVASAGSCHTTDDWEWDLWTGYLDDAAASYDDFFNGCNDQTIQDLDDNLEDRSETELDSDLIGVESDSEVISTYANNGKEYSESYIWMKVESSIANSSIENLSESEAHDRSVDVIRDHRSAQQINLIESWNETMMALHQIEHADQRSLDDEYVETYIELTGSETTPEDETFQTLDYNETYEVHLANGSTRDVYGIDKEVATNLPHTITHPGGSSDWEYSVWEISTDNESVKIYDDSSSATMTDTFHDLNQTSKLEDDADVLIDNTYQDLLDGSLDPDDVISKSTMLMDYGVDDDNMSSALAYSAMGNLSIPANETGWMSIRTMDEDYTGLLLAEEAPNGTWQVNQTYDPDDISGPVWIATESDVHLIDSNFTVESMSSKSGEEIQSVNATSPMLRTVDLSDMLDRQQNMVDLLDQIEDRRQMILSGAAAAGGWDPDQSTIVLILVGVVGLVLVLSRS